MTCPCGLLVAFLLGFTQLLPEQVEGGRRGKKGKHRQQQEAEEQEAEEDACVGGILTPGFKDSEETFAFSMCNPPFFTSMDVSGHVILQALLMCVAS